MIENSPPMSEKSMSRKHFAPPRKTEGNESVFLVSKANVDSHCINKSDTKVIVTLGKKKLPFHANSHRELSMPRPKRRHYDNIIIKNITMKYILNVENENGENSTNFGVDFYKRNKKIPERIKHIKMPQKNKTR
jgi:hypothetical protein